MKKYKFKGNIKKLAEERDFLFRKCAKGKIKPLPGFRGLVKKLKGYKLGIATGAARKNADLVIKELNLKRIFKVIVTKDDVRKSKPNPDSYILASKKLKLKPKECLVIEDSSTGVKAAKSAGMFCIAVPSKFTRHQDFSKADLIVRSLKEIDLNMDGSSQK